jgi:hypothetical protein
MLIDDPSSEIFDELYKMTKEHTHNTKEAHKIMKDLIKVAIKIGILYQNNQFSHKKVIIVEKFRKNLSQTTKTMVNFSELKLIRTWSSSSCRMQERVHELVH